MVNVLLVFILLICCVFVNSQNIGLKNYSKLLNYEIEDIQLVDETICPQPPPCYQPLKYDVQYRCRSDVTCPRGFKCCLGECFILHKVCVQPYHVKKLQFFEPPAKNASLPETLLFDSSNATLLDDIKVKLSENFMKILANESGHLIFNSPGSLISLATILPLLRTTSLDDSESSLADNYSAVLKSEGTPKEDSGYSISFNETQFNETTKEYDQSSEHIIGNYEILEATPLTQNYESTENSTETVNNDIINIDDAIIERNLESDKETFNNDDSRTTTIRTTNAEGSHNFITKEEKHNKNHKQITSRPIKGIKLPDIQNNIKSIRSYIDGFEDDTDYFEGSSDDDGIVTSTPYFVKKEYDGSGNYNIETDAEGSGDSEETTSSAIFSTSQNYLEKEYNGAQNNKETDEESKYKVGIGSNEETHTSYPLISSTYNYVGKEYDRTEDYNKETTEPTKSEIGNSDKDETNTLSSVISSTSENNVYNKQKDNLLKNIKKSVIKNINRAIKTSNGFEDDVDYSEGSGGIEDEVGSGDFLKENEKLNIIALVKLMNDNKLFRHAAHYWKQFERFRDDDDYVEGSGSSEDKLSSQTTASTISFTKGNSDFSSDVVESQSTTYGSTSISSITDEDRSSLFTSSIPQVSKPKHFIGLEDDYYYDLQDDDTTTITNQIPLTTISRISTKSRLEDSNTNTYLIANYDDSSTPKTEVTTEDIHAKPTLEGSGNSDDEMISSGDNYDYDYNFSEPSDNLSSEINRTSQSQIFSNSTQLDQNEVTDSVNTFKEYTASDTFAGKESAKEYALPQKKFESTTDNILKFTKINEKEIQKESSVPNNLFKNDKEQSFKKSDYSQDISVAKAALDMMKESTGNEPDDYYEDDNQIMF